ncbi:MAG: hypothetical protein ACRD4H_07575 [Candidatus Acidiferrales bacterium]
MASAAIVASSMLQVSGVPVRATPELKKQAATQPRNDNAWSATVKKSEGGYHVVSVTNLTGSPARETTDVEIASGAFQGWRWKVEADPSLLPSWNAWESQDRVKKSAQLPADDWSYPAFDWRRAFERVHRVVSYFLGHEPLGLDTTVILIPEGAAYHETVDQVEDSAVPITLGFPFPAETSSSRIDQANRFAALLQAPAETINRYYQVLVAEGFTAQVGQDEAAKEVNAEAEGICWYEGVSLALTAAGPHFHSSLHWNQQTSAAELTHHPPTKIQLADAAYWAGLREAESISGYLESRGMKNYTFSGKDPAAMNAVLSVCRAMTQHPVDLTTSAYPPSQVQYVPFFPVPLNSKKTSN